jgi:hypothetical protein
LADYLAGFAISIIGGKPAESGELEECGTVGFSRLGWMGSGVLIHPRVLLTVAHLQSSQYGAPPDRVMLRSTDGSQPDRPILETPTGAAGTEILSGEWRAHPHGFTQFERHDIAAFLLDRPSKVKPMALASDAEIRAAKHVRLAGFSANARFNKPRFSEIGPLRKVSVPVQYLKDGQAGPAADWARRQLPNEDFQFVVGTTTKGSTVGDSGGPAFIEDFRGNRKLVGLIKAVDPSRGGFTNVLRIDVHRAWIKQQLKLVGE